MGGRHDLESHAEGTTTFYIEFFIVEDTPLTAVGAADTPAPGREVGGGVVTRCS